MIIGYRCTVPAYPPQIQYLLLILGNLILYVYSQNFMIYEVFIYVYGMMTLISKKQCDFKRQYHQTIFLNVILFWIEFKMDIVLRKYQELIIFFLICAIYSQLLYNCIKQIFQSIRIGRKLTFSHVFIAIQYITINKFFIYFTGIQELRPFPLSIRIIQNLKVMTPKSIRAIIRFLIIIISLYVPDQTIWLILHIIFTLWQIYADYYYSFKINRLYQDQFCYFPTKTYVIMFFINCICRFSWVFSPAHSSLMIVLRKLIQNYFRFQSLSAQRKQQDFAAAIISMINNRTDDITA